MKNFNKLLFIFISLLIVYFIYIRYFSENIDKNTKDDIAVNIDSTPQKIIFEEKKIEESNEFYDIKVKYPKDYRDKKNIIEEKIISIVKQKQEEWKIGGELYNQEKDLSLKYTDRPIVKYELNIQYDKSFSEKNNVAGYIFKIYEFTGGAHGNTSITTYAFDENNLLSIDKYININEGSNAIKLTKILREKLKKNLGEYVNTEMLDQGLGLSMSNYDYKTNFKNFIITDDGIRFLFEQYQVAPYSAGMQDVLLTWKELDEYLIK